MKHQEKNVHGISEITFINCTNQRRINNEVRMMHTYDRTSTEPPPVPKVWHFSTFKIESDESATEFRDKLFDNLKDFNIEVIASNWRYCLETVTPYYVKAHCYFFKEGEKTIADIQLIQGDRFTWATIINNILGKSTNRPRKRGHPIRFDDSSAYMLEPYMEESVFDLIGTDVNPNLLTPLIRLGDENIQRCALRALANCEKAFDPTIIESVRHMPKITFLQRRIHHWIDKIMKKTKYVAHL
jgi:hypothetical protein